MKIDSPTLGWLIELLEPRLKAALATRGTVGGTKDGALQEALLALTSQRLEIEKPGRGGPAGMSRLRNLKYWRERQRLVCETVDRTILELLDDRTQGDSDDSMEERAAIFALSLELGNLIDHLPRRCRNLLRLHYGLDVATDQIAIKLGDQKSGVRKATDRCLAALAQAIVELGLELRAPR